MPAALLARRKFGRPSVSISAERQSSVAGDDVFLRM